MSQEIAEKFIAALHELEENKNVESIAALYSDDAEIANVVAPKKFEGAEGAREFWTKYRETFGAVHSEFRNQIYGDRTVALEWTTTGTSSNDTDIVYSGVTILEIDADKITRSCAYFNSQDLGKQIESGAPPKENQAVAA